jgi:hypothetical protein
LQKDCVKLCLDTTGKSEERHYRFAEK